MTKFIYLVINNHPRLHRGEQIGGNNAQDLLGSREAKLNYWLVEPSLKLHTLDGGLDERVSLN